MNHQLISLLSVGLVAGLILQYSAAAAVSPRNSDAIPVSSTLQRTRRTIGSATAFVNCLEVDGSRFCSYDHVLLEAIERAGASSSFRSCPEGRVFRHRCNTCECKKDGTMACSTDLCADDFYDARTGLPKLW